MDGREVEDSMTEITGYDEPYSESIGTVCYEEPEMVRPVTDYKVGAHVFTIGLVGETREFILEEDMTGRSPKNIMLGLFKIQGGYLRLTCMMDIQAISKAKF